MIPNAENAKKGGPKTKEGKAAVRLNAIKHGLLCRDLLLPDERRRTLYAFRESFIAYLQPEGPVESMLVEIMVSCSWRIARAIRMERDHKKLEYSYEHLEYKFQGDSYESRPWLNLMRYETSLQRQFYRALHEFQRQKMERQGSLPPAPVAIDIDLARED
jgi:hypothetical protein